MHTRSGKVVARTTRRNERMAKLRRTAALFAVMALAAVPSGIATASSSQAGQHGNHCGLGHAKHVKGQGGLHTGQSCVKVTPGGDDDGGDDPVAT